MVYLSEMTRYSHILRPFHAFFPDGRMQLIRFRNQDQAYTYALECTQISNNALRYPCHHDMPIAAEVFKRSPTSSRLRSDVLNQKAYASTIKIQNFVISIRLTRRVPNNFSCRSVLKIKIFAVWPNLISEDDFENLS